MKNLFRFLVAMAFVCLTSNLFAVAYWNCSSPTGSASGTWNQNNLTWTDSGTYQTTATGGATDPSPISWATVGTGQYASAFSLGTAANGVPGAYTITVDNSEGQVESGDILIYNGPATFTGGALDFAWIVNGSPSSSTDAGLVFTIHTNQIAYMDLSLTDSGTLPYAWTSEDGDISRSVFANKQGDGILYLGATNFFTGDIAVKSGILALTCDQSLPTASSLILMNGSDIGGVADQESNTPPVFNTGGHNQTLDQLVLTGPNAMIPRTIDFQNGMGALVFTGDSTTLSWNSSASWVFGDSDPGPINLVIKHYVIGTTQLRFGTSSSGLTAAQLAQIQFADYTNAPGRIDSLGYVSPAFSQPYIYSFRQTYTIDWTATSGLNYQVQYASSLSGPWTNLAVVTATGSTCSYTDVTPGASQRFYRIIQE